MNRELKALKDKLTQQQNKRQQGQGQEEKKEQQQKQENQQQQKAGQGQEQEQKKEGSPEDLKDLVIARLDILSPHKRIHIGSVGEFTKDELIERVKIVEEMWSRSIWLPI